MVGVVVAVESDCGTVGVVALGTELSVGTSVFSVLGVVVVVCGSEIVNERMTSVASAYVALPAALAFNVQVPTVSIVTSSPATVQTSSVVDVSTTERFELDIAVTTKGVDENSRSTGPVNEMVWAARGLTIVDAGDDAVVVDPFVAVVVNVYAVPAVKPATTHEVAGSTIVQVTSPGDDFTRYEVGSPPVPRFAVTRTLWAKDNPDGARGVVISGLHATWV